MSHALKTTERNIGSNPPVSPEMRTCRGWMVKQVNTRCVIPETDFCRPVAACDYIATTHHLDLLRIPIENVALLCQSLLELGSSVRHASPPNDIRQVVVDAMRIAQACLHGIALEMRYLCEGVLVTMNPFQFQRVITNLVQNAQHAIAQGREVSVCDEGKVSVIVHPMRRAPDRDMLRNIGNGAFIGVSVIDNGTGMDEDVFEKVAQPFFTTKRESKGNGLGMFISAYLAELCGGTLMVRTCYGRGTSVTLCLPMYAS